MAPRLVPIAVRRVDKLEAAAREFLADKPLQYADISSVKEPEGKSIVVAGEILEARVQNHQTVFLLDVPEKNGCPKSSAPCRVRLVHGFPNPGKAGDTITVPEAVIVDLDSVERAAVPEIQVAFTLAGGPRQ